MRITTFQAASLRPCSAMPRFRPWCCCARVSSQIMRGEDSVEQRETSASLWPPRKSGYCLAVRRLSCKDARGGRASCLALYAGSPARTQRSGQEELLVWRCVRWALRVVLRLHDPVIHLVCAEDCSHPRRPSPVVVPAPCDHRVDSESSGCSNAWMCVKVWYEQGPVSESRSEDVREHYPLLRPRPLRCITGSVSRRSGRSSRALSFWRLLCRYERSSSRCIPLREVL
jgi:hypothetical protein